MSLKLFTKSNFNKQAKGFNSYKIVDKPSSGEPDIQSNPMLSNIRNLSEFQTAFFWCEKLRHKVNPADFSFDSLRLFLLENDHFYQLCNADGFGHGTIGQGSFCAQFSDYVIKIFSKEWIYHIHAYFDLHKISKYNT